MADQVGDARADIEMRLASLGSDAGDARIRLQSQLSGLAGLERRLSLASGGSLVAMRGEVAAYLAAAKALADMADAAAGAGQGGPLTPEAKARQAVQNFVQAYYVDRKFDDYLVFSSPEDEAAYRKREAERRKAIDEALALGTSEGARRAAELAKEQLVDAGRHGAERSPDYAPAFQSLDTAERGLSPAAERPAAPSASQTANVDPLDDVGPSKAVPPSIIANLQSAGVKMPSDGEGHGLSTDKGGPAISGRG